MSNPFESLLDSREEYIYDMGLAPLCSAMCEALGIPETINRALGPRDSRAVLDFGLITKAFIIDMLTERSYPVHFPSGLEELDCEVLFGEGVTADLFTEDRLGDTLDAVSELNHAELMRLLSLRGLDIHGVPVSSSHIDTTNLSLYGDFAQADPAEDFSVEYGMPKDGRRDFRLVTVGGAIQQDGLPVFGEGLSGNTSDALWFREAMDEMASFCSGDLHDNPILIYDAAASSRKTFDKSFDTHMPCIIRLSKRFTVTDECIGRAWEEDHWQDVGTVAEQGGEGAAAYRISSFDVELGKNDWRVLIVHSSSLERRKEAALSRKLPELKEKLTKSARELAGRRYDSEDEARSAGDRFIRDRSAREKLFSYEVEVKPEISGKYERPGRPGPHTKKIKTTTYHPVVTVGDVDPEEYRKRIEYESCFALVTSVPKTRCTDEKILKEYKRQWKIENCFEFIKSPKLLRTHLAAPTESYQGPTLHPVACSACSCISAPPDVPVPAAHPRDAEDS